MTVRAEGWYADPQQAGRLRWWDGSRWTAHTHDLPGTSAHHGALPRWWSGVTTAVQLGLLLTIASSLFVLHVDQEVLGFIDDVRLRPDTVTEADGARIDELLVQSSVALLPWLGTGVLFVVWSYTLHHSNRMDRSVLRHGSGWAIGGWFVPVLSLWRPFQMMLDVRRGSTGDADLPTTRTLGWWWATFWLSYAAGMVATFHYRAFDSSVDDPDGPSLDHFASAATWERGSELVSIVAALLAIRVVREVRSLVRAGQATHAG